MTRILFNCDRCKKPTTGLHTARGTAGFYVVDQGGPWEDFSKETEEHMPDEHLVCDRCIQAMPLYRERYEPPKQVLLW